MKEYHSVVTMLENIKIASSLRYFFQIFWSKKTTSLSKDSWMSLALIFVVTDLSGAGFLQTPVWEEKVLIKDTSKNPVSGFSIPVKNS